MPRITIARDGCIEVDFGRAEYQAGAAAAAFARMPGRRVPRCGYGTDELPDEPVLLPQHP